jgi:peptidoglycan-associated lipoprotein
MIINTQRAARFALIAGVALSLAACASHPKPTPQPEPQQPQAPYTPPAEPMHQQPAGPVPGSTQDFVISAGDRVFFDFDAYSIRPDAAQSLATQAEWLKRYPGVRIRIEGNADERGTVEYNFALGGRRANSVKEFLVAHGVSAARIDTVSYGKARPIDGGEGEDAWAHNRNAHTTLTDGAR